MGCCKCEHDWSMWCGGQILLACWLRHRCDKENDGIEISDVDVEIGCDELIDEFVATHFISKYCRIMDLVPSQIEIISFFFAFQKYEVGS